MANLQEYYDLKEELEEAKRKKERAAGALEEAKARMKENFQVDSLEEAEELLEELSDEEHTLQDKFETALDEYKKKWEGAE